MRLRSWGSPVLTQRFSERCLPGRGPSFLSEYAIPDQIRQASALRFLVSSGKKGCTFVSFTTVSPALTFQEDLQKVDGGSQGQSALGTGKLIVKPALSFDCLVTDL